MSAEEFIYNMINAENVDSVDSNVIANTICSTDSLIRQIKTQSEENGKMKEKVNSLRSSAMQIKQLYELERIKNAEHSSNDSEYLKRIKELEQRCTIIENEKINMKLTNNETIADLEKKMEASEAKYNHMCFDMARHCGILSANNLLPCSYDSKFRELKNYLLTSLLDVPLDVVASIQKSPRRGKKSKKIGPSTKEQSTNTCVETTTIGVNTLRTKLKSVATNTMEDTVKEVKQFCDKGTMHSMSTITRSTCTSAFIKRVDVGLNFPEIIPKSIEDIFKECVVTLPPPLTPIVEVEIVRAAEISTQTEEEVPNCITEGKADEITVQKDESSTQTEVECADSTIQKGEISTQTEEKLVKDVVEKADFSTQTEEILNANVWIEESPETKKQYNTCGTITSIKNIRKKINYCKKIKLFMSSKQLLHQELLKNVKKEELSPAVSMHNLSFPAFSSEMSNINPHLTNLWALLGETIFKLMGNGRMFDTHSFNTFNEKMTLIKNMMETEHRDRPISNVPAGIQIETLIEQSTIVSSKGNEERVLHVSESESESSISNLVDEQFMIENFIEAEDEVDDTGPLEIFEAEENVEQEVCQPIAVTAVPPVEISKTISQKSYEDKASDNHISSDLEEHESPLHIVVDPTSPEEINVPSYVPVVSTILQLNMPSPIKLKETMSLIKDQFKTPTQISRCPKKRSSEITTAVPMVKKSKVDDWDSQLVTIKSYFELPSLIGPLDNKLELTPLTIDTKIDSHVDYDSPLSPTEVVENLVPPIIIPLNHVSCSGIKVSKKNQNTAIGRIIDNYNFQARDEIVKRFQLAPNEVEDNHVKHVRTIVHEYIVSEWTAQKVEQHCLAIVNYTNVPKIIIAALLETVIAYEDLTVNTQFSPPAPAIPETHQKLVLFVKKMTNFIPSLELQLLDELNRKIFSLKSESLKLQPLLCYTHFYVGLVDGIRHICANMRMFIYKCLYYYGFKSLPMIYIILRAYPHVLPKKNSTIYDNSDAIVSTIRTILMNINYNEKMCDDLYNKVKLLMLLKHFYGYTQGSPTYEELTQNLIDKIRANKLKNVSFSLILLAKRNGYKWASENIIRPHIYPLLNEYLHEVNKTEGFDDRIVTCIFTMSSILKTQSNVKDISDMMQVFTTLLQTTDKKTVQEAAIEGLIKLTRFGYPEIYERLCTWVPHYDVSNKIKLMLMTFVHRKEPRFWNNLNKQI